MGFGLCDHRNRQQGEEEVIGLFRSVAHACSAHGMPMAAGDPEPAPRGGGGICSHAAAGMPCVHGLYTVRDGASEKKGPKV